MVADVGERLSRWVAARSLLLLSLVPALVARRAPVPFRNQHTYLLHGVAAVDDSLAGDWLAQTADPQPLFSALVAAAQRAELLVPALIGLQFLAAWLFAYCLLLLVASVASDGAKRGVLVLVAGTLSWWFALNPSAMPLGGLAYQYLLGDVFQPSSFGLLLLFAVPLAERGRSLLAVAFACAAASVHPTYLPTAALLALGLVLWRPEGARLLWQVGLPVAWLGLTLLFVGAHFPPGLPGAERAAAVLVHQRLPHHALVSQWFNGPALGATLLAAFGIWAFRSGLAGRLLSLLLCVSVVGTALAHFSGVDWLALAFPWRSSVVWMPAGSVLAGAAGYRIVGRYLAAAVPFGGATPQRRPLWAAAALAVMAAPPYVLALYRPHGGEPLAAFRMRLQGNALPAGSLLAVVPPRAADGARLHLSVPVYADWKSHPYRSDEVLEWWRRVQIEQALADDPSCRTLKPLMDAGVTHLLTRQTVLVTDVLRPWLTSVARDGELELWSLSHTQEERLAACAREPASAR